MWAERIPGPAGVFIADETGFAKQGKKSVGVHRQYSGTLGKTDNCQVGVFLAYAAPGGHALIDGRLFLPEAWVGDALRCRAAGVPEEERRFRTKPELALEMIAAARSRGHLSGEWVTADAVYGNSPTFRDGLEALGLQYVLEVQSTLRVFEHEVETVLPVRSGRGPQFTRRRVVPGSPPAREVREIGASLSPEAWHLQKAAEGSQGPRVYRFQALRIWESKRRGLPGRTSWLLVRENLDGSEPRYFLSNASATTPLQKLAEVASIRWSVEEEFQITKGECGLDEYEVRSWSGWHHHITLAMLAGAFLLELEKSWKKNQPRTHAPTSRTYSVRDAAQEDMVPSQSIAMAPPHSAEEPRRKGVTREAAQAQRVGVAA
jgi:SRSO17 transposase